MRRALPLRLGDVAASRNNNFDVLRLLAAYLVLVSHAAPLTGNREPLAHLGGPTMGGLGVALFFTMSGFLITKSWLAQPELRLFIRKRALRIMPGLWAALFLTAIVLGTAVSTLGAVSYLTSAEPWVYVARCAALITFDGSLPGVFADNPFPDAINGSLWTLPLEVCAYAIVVILGLSRLLTRRPVLPALWIAFVLLAVLPLPAGGTEVATLFAYFITGMLAYTLRHRIRLSGIVAVLGVGAWVAAFDTPLLPIVAVVTLPYAVFVAAYRTPTWLRRSTAAGDVSYGVYIYAFPLQQTIVWLWPGHGYVWNTLIAAPIVWIVAYVSWKVVEQPALRRKPGRVRTPTIDSGAAIPPTSESIRPAGAALSTERRPLP